MLTGDNKKVAHWVAEQLVTDEVYAEVLPDDKANQVKEIQSKRWKVAMTGDGVNDAPALVTADVVLVKSNPKDVVDLMNLSKKTYQKMVQNLWWATGYHIFTIPLAAGVLAPIGIICPAGAVLISLSTIVVANRTHSLVRLVLSLLVYIALTLMWLRNRMNIVLDNINLSTYFKPNQ